MGDKGQQYAFRIDKQLTGYIWLNDDHGWTLGNGDFCDDWRECGLKLTALTRNNLYKKVFIAVILCVHFIAPLALLALIPTQSFAAQSSPPPEEKVPYRGAGRR